MLCVSTAHWISMFHSLMGANFSHRILSTAVMHGSRLTVFVWQIVEFGGTNNVFVSVSGCTESSFIDTIELFFDGAPPSTDLRISAPIIGFFSGLLYSWLSQGRFFVLRQFLHVNWLRLFGKRMVEPLVLKLTLKRISKGVRIILMLPVNFDENII